MLQIFNETLKCAASTQTDAQTDEEIETNTTLERVSVGTESVPERISRPKYLRE